MGPWRQILLALLLLAAVLAVIDLADLDVCLQDRFYLGGHGRWLIDREEPVARAFFYTGFKAALGVLGGLCAAGFALSWKLPRLRARRLAMLRVALATALVPLAAMGVKQFTNVYLPAQVDRYGGDKPHVKPFHAAPPGLRGGPGRGFPASHASGGFSLMILFYAFTGRRRWIALALALALAWAAALYQTLNGQHFLSHALGTWALAWIVIQLIVLATARLREPEPPGTLERQCLKP